MAVPTKPELKRSQANDSWGFVPAVAVPSAPTLAELNATAGYNLSCSIFSDQEGPTVTDNRVTLPTLSCEVDEIEVAGTTTHAMPEFQVSFDPQAAADGVGKKAWTTMVDGMNGFLWRRQGVNAKTDLAADQWVDVFPVTLGTKVPTKTSNGPEGVYSFRQSVSLRSNPVYNVQIEAA